MMDDIEIKVTVRTEIVGSQVEDVISFDRDDWESMSDKEKDDALLDEALKLIEWNYEEVI